MVSEALFALVIVSVCLLLHVFGILVVGYWVSNRREFFERRGTVVQYLVGLVIPFTVIMFLHLVEAGVWAVFYYSRRLLPDFESSVYFSLITYSTIGYGDIVLPQRWRVLGAVEGVSGVLLSGLSAAFIFAIVNGLFQMRLQRASNSSR
jgi:voltage-gated potassium channel